jgi:hypothetical protein
VSCESHGTPRTLQPTGWIDKGRRLYEQRESDIDGEAAPRRLMPLSPSSSFAVVVRGPAAPGKRRVRRIGSRAALAAVPLSEHRGVLRTALCGHPR